MRFTSIVKPSSFVCPNSDIYSSFCKECILREILNQSLLCSMLGVGGVRLRPPGKAEVSTSSKVLACSFLYAKRRTTCNCFFTKELTGMNVRASLTLSGTAWTSLMLAAGRITVVNPALCAPNTLNWYFKNTQWKNSFCAKMLRFFWTITLSRTPPTGSTRPCKEISPVIAWILDDCKREYWILDNCKTEWL